MAKTNVGVVVGRFQVPELTQGHHDLLTAVMERSDALAILLGVSPLDGRTRENPLTYSQRKPLFDRYSDAMLLPIFNQPDDKIWSENLDDLLSNLFPNSTVTLFGGRDSFANSYSGKFKVETLSFQMSAAIQGTQARNAIKESITPNFLRGQIYSLSYQYPKTYPTVDIALIKDGQILLIQRTDTSQWVLPGGFVDPSDKSLEIAAKRELYEEIGISSNGIAKYIGSTIIDDWRYRGTSDKIMTSLFVIEHVFGSPVPNPLEVQDYKWIGITEATRVIAPHHLPLIYMISSRPSLFESDLTGKVIEETKILRG